MRETVVTIEREVSEEKATAKRQPDGSNTATTMQEQMEAEMEELRMANLTMKGMLHQEQANHKEHRAQMQMWKMQQAAERQKQQRST